MNREYESPFGDYLKCFYVFQLRDELENLLVSHGDVIALQHDAGRASLVHCQSSPHSAWRQPVFALNLSEWFWINQQPDPWAGTGTGTDPLPDPVLDLKALVKDGESGWLEDAVCPVRVLYVGQSETRLQGPPLEAGLPQPGLYDLLVRRSSLLATLFTVHRRQLA